MVGWLVHFAVVVVRGGKDGDFQWGFNRRKEKGKHYWWWSDCFSGFPRHVTCTCDNKSVFPSSLRHASCVYLFWGWWCPPILLLLPRLLPSFRPIPHFPHRHIHPQRPPVRLCVPKSRDQQRQTMRSEEEEDGERERDQCKKFLERPSRAAMAILIDNKATQRRGAAAAAGAVPFPSRLQNLDKLRPSLRARVPTATATAALMKKEETCY